MAKILFFLLLLLCGVYLYRASYPDPRAKRTDFTLVDIDSASITSIVISPKFADEDELTLTRSEQGWIVSKGTLNVKAVNSAVNELLANISYIRSDQLVSQQPEDWSNYNLDDDQSIRLQIYSSGKLINDLRIGRTAFDEESRAGVAYTRMSGENEVYAIDGYQAISVGRGFSVYRDKTVLRIPSDIRIDSMVYQPPDTLFSIVNQAGRWVMADEVVLDTAAVLSYLADLQQVYSSAFADDMDENYIKTMPQTTVRWHSSQLEAPLLIEIYQDTVRQRPFLIRSVQKPAVWFDSDSLGIYRRLIPDLSGWRESTMQ